MPTRYSTNILIQASALALIGIAATFFDPTVDVVHSTIAGMFAVLFNACRIPPYDLSPTFVRSRAALTTIMARIWLI
jgi:hypothetical protein